MFVQHGCFCQKEFRVNFSCLVLPILQTERLSLKKTYRDGNKRGSLLFSEALMMFDHILQKPTAWFCLVTEKGHHEHYLRQLVCANQS